MEKIVALKNAASRMTQKPHAIYQYLTMAVAMAAEAVLAAT